jgi:hypothetical protein
LVVLSLLLLLLVMLLLLLVMSLLLLVLVLQRAGCQGLVMALLMSLLGRCVW